MTTPAIALANKPPLTRRWTPVRPEVFAWGDQTSAHAEMDPQTSFSSGVAISNLRSRGDGPKVGAEIARTVAKPPLTRRWTHLGHDVLDLVHQTSAHAEMDPDRLRPCGRRFPNLRSRGDGPVRLGTPDQTALKPPLTRRWTPTH